MSNLFKRFITSFVLLSILIFCFIYSLYSWTFFLIVTSIISFIEFKFLIKKIWRKEKKIIFIFNIVSIIYLLLLIYVSLNIYIKSPSFLFFILLICFFSDTGGYLVGNLVGGKKLTKISPNKTISGSVGSFVFSIIPIFIYYIINEYTEHIESNLYDNWLVLTFVCLFLSLVCQLGDLFISYFKRKAVVNDTGSILPGHGGLLDRIDGTIFVLPVAYVLNILIF